MKSIAFGQYYPANSVLHRMDPRIKLVISLLYIVCTFLCKNILSFSVLLASAIVLIVIGRVPLKIVLRSMRAVLIILMFTAVLNIFWTDGERIQ